MRQSQFIKAYCKSRGVTEKFLHDQERFAVPCDCGEGGCEGWAMIRKGGLQSHIDLYIKKNRPWKLKTIK